MNTCITISDDLNNHIAWVKSRVQEIRAHEKAPTGIASDAYPFQIEVSLQNGDGMVNGWASFYYKTNDAMLVAYTKAVHDWQHGERYSQ